MRSRILSLCAGVLIAYVAVAAPAATAFPSDVPIMGLFVRSAAGGGTELGFRPPDAASASVAVFQSGTPLVPKVNPVCQPVPVVGGQQCTPPVNAVGAPCVALAGNPSPQCVPAVLGKTLVPRAFTVLEGNSALTVWLRSDQAVLLESVAFSLQKITRGGQIFTLVRYDFASGQGTMLQAAPIVLDTNPRSLTLGARILEPIAVEEHDVLQLTVTSVRTAASTSNQFNIFLLSSAAQPSRLQVPITHNYAAYVFEDLRLGDHTLGVYLDNQSLSLLTPTNENASLRGLGAAVGQAPTELIWGNTTVDEDTTLVGYAVYEVFLQAVEENVQAGDQSQVAPGVLAGLQFGITLYVGDAAYEALTHTVAAPTTSEDGVTWFVGAIRLPPIDVPAGTPIEIGLRVVGEQAHGSLAVLYGSPEYASGLRIPTLGGGTVLPEPELPIELDVPPAPTGTPQAAAPTEVRAPSIGEPLSEPDATEQDDARGNSSPYGVIAVKKQISARGEAPGPSAVFVLLAALGRALARRRK